MEELTVDITYGQALFDAAQDLNEISRVKDEIGEVSEIFQKNPGFFEMLKTPVIPNEEKKQILEKVFSGELCQSILNFIYVLIDKRRVSRFDGIVKTFYKLVDEKNGITTGTIYSAVEIPEGKLKTFEEETGKLLRKNVSLKNEIDTSLIAGVKIYIDGKLIDASIRRRIDDLKERLL